MSQLQPESEASKLIDEVERFRLESDISDFDLKRLKNKAMNVKKRDLAMGFGLLGMIACLENDTDAMRSYFKRAIEQSGCDPFHILNYVVSLDYFGLYQESYEYALKAYEKDRSYIKSLDILIEITCFLNKKEEFEKYTSAWRKLTQKDHKLKTYPLYYQMKPKECHFFLKRYSDDNILPLGHLHPYDILTACAPAIVRFFGTPISVIVEIMPDPESNHEPELVAFIQWFGDMEEGMKRYDQFENWYIENDYDLKTDLVVFSIELVGE